MALPNPPRKILLLTNVERGEANVFLATCDALLRLAPNVELHFVTFGGLEETVASVSRHVQESGSQVRPIIFHKIQGLAMEESLRQHFVREKVPTRAGYPPNSYLERPGIISTTRAIRHTIPVFVPYNGPQMVEVFTSICETIQQVHPDLVVVNGLMTAGLTACYHLGVKFTCLSPNSIKDFAASMQPKAAGLWKIPAYDIYSANPITNLLIASGCFLGFPTQCLGTRYLPTYTSICTHCFRGEQTATEQRPRNISRRKLGQP